MLKVIGQYTVCVMWRNLVVSGLCGVEWQTDESATPYSTEYISLALHYVTVYITKGGHPNVSQCTIYIVVSHNVCECCLQLSCAYIRQRSSVKKLMISVAS